MNIYSYSGAVNHVQESEVWAGKACIRFDVCVICVRCLHVFMYARTQIFVFRNNVYYAQSMPAGDAHSAIPHTDIYAAGLL